VPSASDFTDGSFSCTLEHLAVATERQQRIAEAATVEEARDLALTPARAARRALQVAGMVGSVEREADGGAGTTRGLRDPCAGE
jgi:hypothetical protein